MFREGVEREAVEPRCQLWPRSTASSLSQVRAASTLKQTAKIRHGYGHLPVRSRKSARSGRSRVSRKSECPTETPDHVSGNRAASCPGLPVRPAPLKCPGDGLDLQHGRGRNSPQITPPVWRSQVPNWPSADPRPVFVGVASMGLLVLVVITAASVQDRYGARTLLDRLKMAMLSLLLLWVDGGYAGKLVDWADRVAHITVEIARKPLGIKRFEVLPRRWVVERTFAWIVKCRRLDHDYERLPETSEAMVKWAMIGLMVRRIEPPPGRKPWQRASTADLRLSQHVLVDRLDDCARTDLPVGEDVGAQAAPVDQAAERALRGEAFQVGARLT